MSTILYARERKSKPLNLTKTFTMTPDGVHKTDYELAWRFDLNPIRIDTFEALAYTVEELAHLPNHCLVRGVPTGGLTNVPRTLYDNESGEPASLQMSPSGVSWVMLDFDKVPVSSLDLTTADERLAFLVSTLPSEFHSSSFVYQWSASAGVKGWDTLSCHLWFMLDRPWFCSDLRDRAQYGDWKGLIDPAPFCANQIHYTASPIFVGMPDPVENRVGVVRGTSDTVTLTPWVKPVEPVSPYNDRQHYALFGLSRFNDLLADIGPNYHEPIRRAAAHYASVVPLLEYDEGFALTELTNAIYCAPAGRNAKRDYLDPTYLKRMLRTGKRKFGRNA